MSIGIENIKFNYLNRFLPDGNITYDERGNLTEIEEDGVSTTFNYDEFDMLISTNGGGEYSTHTYDYRGRRVEHGFGNANKEYQTTYTYSDGTNVLETKLDMNNASEKTTLFYRGSDQGGGVGGINYSEFANGEDLNYKFYNLRGDVVMTIDSNNVRKNKYLYFGFGKNELEQGSEIETDKHRANTKVEDENNFLNEGKRFRHLELDVFLTPDPLEYVDGFNPYIYCNQNPWGRWDPLGLAEYFRQECKKSCVPASLRNLKIAVYDKDMGEEYFRMKVNEKYKEGFKELGVNVKDINYEHDGASMIDAYGVMKEDFSNKKVERLEAKSVAEALNIISSTGNPGMLSGNTENGNHAMVVVPGEDGKPYVVDSGKGYVENPNNPEETKPELDAEAYLNKKFKEEKNISVITLKDKDNKETKSGDVKESQKNDSKEKQKTPKAKKDDKK